MLGKLPNFSYFGLTKGQFHPKTQNPHRAAALLVEVQWGLGGSADHRPGRKI